MNLSSSGPGGFSARNTATAVALLIFLTGTTSHRAADQTPPKTDEVITLSPFEVNTSQDYGYQAQNTLSGSRLNTALKDTAAPISVFTKEFLEDIGAINLGDVAEWAVGAKIYYNEDEGNQNDLLFNPTIIKVRGQLTSTGRNYYEWVLAVDNYNSERLELSSGPNSILFGIGSPGGIFNTQTKRAQTGRTFATFVDRLGSYGSVRNTFDLNQVVVKDKLAFRVNLLREEAETWRKWEFDNASRQHVTVTWKPARNSTFRAEGEGGLHHTLRSRTFATTVGAQPWLDARAAGLTAPFQSGWIADPYAATGTGNNGTFVRYAGATRLPATMIQYANARLTYDTATGQLMNLQGSTATQAPAGLDESFHDAYVPNTAILQGPTVDQIERPKAYTLTFEQKLLDRLYLELGYNRQKASYRFNDWQFSTNALFVDTTSRLPNGSPNPNAGRAYVQSSPVIRYREDNREIYRALLSYELDFTQRNPWLGSHRFAAQYEDTAIAGRLRNTKLVATNRSGAGFNAAAENDANRVWYRTNVDLADPNTFFWAGYTELAGAPILQGPLNGQTVTTEWVNAAVDNDTIDKLKSKMAVMQNTWFSGRLITALGVRRENLTETSARAVRNADGEYVMGPGAPLGFGNTATTYSAVLHLNRRGTLSAFYNHGSNFRIPSQGHNIIGIGRPPIGTAVSEDYGLKFDWFDGKVSGSVLRFTTVGKNNSENAGTQPQDAINRIWDALAANRLISTQQALANYVLENAVVYNNRSEGYELALIANPTRGWRVMLNASRNETIGGSAGDELVNYLAANGPTLFQDPTLLTANGITIATEKANNIDAYLVSNYLSRNGLAPRGQARYSANLRTNYSFTRGWIKGASAGGGVQWRSAPVVGVTAGNAGDPGRVALYGKAYDTEFLNFGYGGKFRVGDKNIGYKVQLNIDNLFQYRGDYIITQVDTAGTPQQYRFRDPRKFSVTTTLNF